MADPYGYPRPTVVALVDNLNEMRRKVNQISDDLGDKRTLLINPGTSFEKDSDIAGVLIELDYRINQQDSDLYLRIDGGSLFLHNGKTNTTHGEFIYDSAAGALQLNAPRGNFTIDALGDIILDADGNDIIFKNGGGADTVTHTLANDGNFVIAAPANYTVDVVGDITLDAAGDNIFFKDAGTTRVTYTLGATTDISMLGSLTTNVDGSIADSAGTSISQTSGSTFTQTSGSTFAQTSGGNFTTTVTGNVLVDASGDITLDADGNDIIFKNGSGGDQVTHTLADDANYTITAPNNYTVDAVTDIILDADGNDIIFKNGAGSDQVTHSLADDANYVITSPNNYTLDVSTDITLDADGGNWFFKDNAVTQFEFIAGTNKEIDVPSGDLTIDVAGDINLDADGGDVVILDGGVEDYRFATDGTVSRTGDLILDISGDITLDADGNDIIFKNGAGADTVTHTLADTGDYTITSPANYTVDTVGDITLDAAGDNIVFKDAGSTRVTYTLGATTDIALAGNLTTNVGGSIVDSAGTTYTRVAGTNISDTATTGTITQTSGTTFDQVSGGNFTTTVTGNVLVDASGDITLDADGNDIVFKNGAGGDTVTHTLADDANYTITAPNNYIVDAVTDIILDADGNDIIFKNGAGGDTVTHTLADDANYTITAPANYTVDAVGDIILDADGNDIIFKNGAGGDTVTHTLADNADYTITAPDDVVIDAVGDIILDADGNDIFFKDGSITRVKYFLSGNNAEDWTGNLTRNVSGSLVDSAGTSITNVSGTTTTVTVGTDYNLTAGGNSVFNITGSIDEDAGTTIDRTAGTNITDTATAGSYTLNTGTTLEQTAGSSITQTSTTTFDQVSGGNFTTTVTGDVLVDASGDITLDADGNDIIFKNGAGGDTVTHTLSENGDYTIVSPANYTVDTVGDIILDAAGDNIVFKDDGNIRVTYTLGATTDIAMAGSLTTNVGGSIFDSAGTNYTLTANTNILQTALNGSITETSGTTTTQTVGTNYTLTAGGNYTVDVDGSIADSAGTTYSLVAGTSINQTSGTTFDQVSGGNFTTTVTGNVLVDASGDITLDADGNDIIFKNGAGADTVTHTLADDANYTITAPANYTVDAVGDIILDADGGDVKFADAGTVISLLSMTNSDTILSTNVTDKDIIFKGFDGGLPITALTLDMSDAGSAIFNHDAYFPDNGRVVFGAGSDLQIYHDGSNSRILEAGAGFLAIGTNGTDIRLTGNNFSEYMAKFDQDGAVTLYYDNAQKIATTATGIAVTGDTTFPDNGKAIFGAGSDLQIYHDGSKSIIHDVTAGNLEILADDFAIKNSTGVNTLFYADAPSGAVSLYYSNAAKLATTATGIDVTGSVTADGFQTDTANTDVNLLARNSSNAAVYLQNGGTGDVLHVRSGNMAAGQGDLHLKVANNGDISFYEDTGTTPKLTWVASAESLNFADNAKAIFGADSDLQIYHDGSNSYIKDAGTGSLKIQGVNLNLQSTSGESYIDCVNDGAVYVYHNNAAKLTTTATGIQVTGDIVLGDNNPTITMNDSSVVNLQHLITSSSNNLIIAADNNDVDAGTEIQFYVDGVERMATTATGIDITGNATFPDNGKAIFGAGSDLQIYHDGSHSRIADRGTGDLRIYGDSLQLNSWTSAENYLTAATDGAVAIYYNGSSKLATTDTGIDVTGTATMDGLTVETPADPALITLRHTGNTSGLLIRNFSGGEAQLVNVDNGPMVFKTNDTERLRIDSSGNVGIGTVANTGWNSTYKAIQIGNAGAVWSEDASSSNTLISNNEVYNTNGNYYRLVDGPANDILLQNDGSFLFRSTATSEVAGAQILDQTTKMTIDGSGNVGIGVSPTPTAKLDINISTNARGYFSSNIGEVGVGNFALQVVDATGFDLKPLGFRAEDIRFATLGGERARIDSDGTFFVGKKVSSISTVGFETKLTGETQIVRDEATVLRLNRHSDSANDPSGNGTILDLRRFGQNIGVIGSYGGSGYIGTTDTALAFYQSTNAAAPNAVIPFNAAAVLERDAAIDLGSTDFRFKDLHVSGKVNTATADLLGTLKITNAKPEIQLFETDGTINQNINMSVIDGGFYIAELDDNGTEGNKLFGALSSGVVTLYNAGNAKLSTTATGIDVTGTVTADGLTVDGGANFNATATITSTSPALFFMESDVTDLNSRIRNSGGSFQIHTVDDSKTAVAPRLAINNSTGSISFYEDTGTTPKFVWDASAESLGIGTSSPLNSLHIQDSALNKMLITNNDFVNNTTGTSFDVSFGATSGNTYSEIRHLINGRSAWGDFVLARGGGKVGIGTTSPSGELNLSSSANTVFRLDDTNGTSSFHHIETSGINGQNLIISGDQGGTGGGAFIFRVNGADEAMRIDANGNVGIGTDSPDTQDPSANNLVIEDSAGNGGITIKTPTSGIGSIHFSDGTSGADRYRGMVTYGHSDDSMRFHTNAVRRMTIDSSGNVGIGETPNTRLHVSSAITTKSVVETTGASSDALIEFTKGQGSGNTWSMGLDHSNSSAFSLAYLSNGSPSLTTHGLVTVDTSGNVLVGTLSTNPYTSATETGAVVRGVEGILGASRSGGASLRVNRVGTGGTEYGAIAEFRSNGATVGSITADAGYLAIGKGDTGLLFQDGGDAIQPRDITGGANRDAAIDLGVSGGRFKDLYLSGTAFLPNAHIDSAHIDGGVIDNTVIGDAVPTRATFTNVTVTNQLSAPNISPTNTSVNDYALRTHQSVADSSGFGLNTVTFGTDSDLSIFHGNIGDGQNHSYISGKGTGNLILQSNNIVKIKASIAGNIDENMLVATPNAGVALFHNGNTKLETTALGVAVTGLLTADTKSFTIDHPTKEGMKLRYGSLEGPEHGVYVRGRLNGTNTIVLPEVWTGLVDEDTITVNLTSIGKGECWVESIENNTVIVGGHLNCFYMVQAERKDVEKLIVEFPDVG